MFAIVKSSPSFRKQMFSCVTQLLATWEWTQRGQFSVLWNWVQNSDYIFIVTVPFYKIFLWKEYYYRICNSKWFYFQYLWQRTLNDAWMWCDGFVPVLGWDDLMLLLLLVSSWFCICSLYNMYLRLLPVLSRDLRHELGNKWVIQIFFVEHGVKKMFFSFCCNVLVQGIL